MSHGTERKEPFVSVERAASRLGVPAAWLRREARSGGVPSLQAGRRILLNPDDVERVLIDRAREDCETSARAKAAKEAYQP